MSEIWKAVPGWPTYEVSDHGRLRGSRGVVKWQPTHHGYLRITLRNKERLARMYAHRVVLLTFVGPLPDGMEACHLNGVRTDNRLANLAYATRIENHAHKRAHGTLPLGEQVHNAALTEAQVREIREAKARGEFNSTTFMKKFGVSRSTVCLIAAGKRWSHVSGGLKP